MTKNSLLLDKFSIVKNHPLLVAKDVFNNFEKEIHINDLIERVLRKRKTTYKLTDENSENAIDEARIIQAIGTLIAMDRAGYYKGFVYKI